MVEKTGLLGEQAGIYNDRSDVEGCLLAKLPVACSLFHKPCCPNSRADTLFGFIKIFCRFY